MNGPRKIEAGEYLIPITLTPLKEGAFLARSSVLTGLLAEGRTIAETLDLAQDVARKLIESYMTHRDPLPKGLTFFKSFNV